MKVSILVVCVVASLANLVHAQDWALIRKYEGEECKTTLDCTYSDYHRCTGEVTGCQPFMGTFRAPCGSDEDCQYGLSCKKDMQVTQKDVEAHIANGGTQSQKVNTTGIQRCFSNWPLLPPRLNPEKRKIHDYGYQLCEGDNDCPDKSCLFGVCLVRPGAENAFCKGNDWCRDGNLCADLSGIADDFSTHPDSDEAEEAARRAPVGGYCYKYVPAEPSTLKMTCTARGLGCWSDSSCCDGNCIWGPLLGLPKQCAFKS